MTNSVGVGRAALILTLISFFLFPGYRNLSAQYYWVGGSGNWTDYANHWATTSGGSTFHTSVPGATDDVIFDANSFTQTGQVVTLDTNLANCNSMNWTGVQHNPGLVGSGLSTITNVYGSLTLSPNATYDFGVVELESTGSGNTLTFAGNNLGSFSFLRFNGIGGSWTLQDTLNAYFLQYYHGTLNTNNHTLNVGATFSLYGSGTKVLNMGSSDIHTSQWRVSGTNNTLNMGTSTIITNSFYGDQDGDGPFNYYDLIMNEGGIIYNSANFNSITIGNAGNIYNNIRFESGATIDFQTLTVNSSRSLPLEISASISGTAATLSKSSGTVNVSYVILQDIHATGGATFNASQSIDNGNNTGWNIMALTPLNYYWVGDAGNWSDYVNHWATSSGGSTFHTDVPSQFDDVHFDANSFTMASQTVVVDSPYTCASIDFGAVTNSPNFSASYGKPLTVFGSVYFSQNMSGSIYNLHLDGDGTGNTIHQGGVSFQNFGIYGPGDWTLTDNLDVANFNLYDDCTFDSDGYTIDLNFTFRTYDPDVNVYLDTTHLLTRDFILGHRNINFNAGMSNIQVNRDFKGKGASFYHVTMEAVSTIYDQNTFEYLEVLPGADASFEADSTQTINQGIIVPGTASNPIQLSSTNAGTQATFSMSSGTVSGTFLILQDMNGTGGATYNAIESIDNGNNTGWNITALVPLDYYWVGDGGNWSDYANHWATTSGGSTFRLRVPGALDNVYFDGNSFSTSGQTVVIDGAQANFHDMDWSSVTNNPSLSGNNKAMNVYGSLTMSPNMNLTIKDIYFSSDTVETITMGKGMYPGTSSYMYFDGGGEWTMQDSITVRELTFSSGTINTGNNALHANFAFYFNGMDNKTLNLGSSTIFARIMQWSSSNSDNLTLNGSNSHIRFSSSLSLFNSGSNISINLGNLSAVNETFSDNASISYSHTIDTMTIEAGKTLKISSSATLTVDQLVANGTVNDSITIECVQSGQSATISQASGNVNGYYLKLKDNNAIGGAVFNAFNSVDNGNVSGWIFNTSSQTITFGSIPNKLVTDAPFSISATASSGLPVTFTIISGPASVSGNTITLAGTPGMVTVEANQGGNLNYSPAPPVTQSFMVSKLAQTISFMPIPDKAPNDPPFTVSASATSGLPISFGILSGPATIQDSTITLTGGTGTVQVEAAQPGDSLYDMATPVVNTFEVVDSSSGLQGFGTSHIVLWPNPVSDLLQVDLSYYLPGEVNLSVYDLSGKEMEIEVLESDDSSKLSLNVSKLPEGVYILKFNGNESVRFTRSAP